MEPRLYCGNYEKKKTLEAKTIEEFEDIAKGKGGIKSKEFPYAARIPVLNRYLSEISQCNLNSLQLDTISKSRDYLKKHLPKKLNIPKTINENERTNYSRKLLSEKESLMIMMDEYIQREEIRIRREDYQKSRELEISEFKSRIKRMLLIPLIASSIIMAYPKQTGENNLPKISAELSSIIEDAKDYNK